MLVEPATIVGGDEDTGSPSALVIRDDAALPIPVEFPLPCQAIAWVSHHAQVLDDDAAPGLLVVDHKVGSANRLVVATQFRFVGIGNTEMVQQVSNDEFALRPHALPVARSMNQAFLVEDLCLRVGIV